jgi:beta-alanine--pyruvate transaminase
MMAEEWADALHSLRDCPNVIDIRNIGLMGAIELASRPNAPGARGYDALVASFNAGLYFRTSGDVIAMSPPLIVESRHIQRIVEILRGVLSGIA